MTRWIVNSIEEAGEQCGQRNAEGISCTLHLLDEYIRDPAVAKALTGQYVSLIEMLDREDIQGGISIKLTSLGALVDADLARNLARDLAIQARQHRVGFEIDMEGRGLVEFTLQTALFIREQGLPVVLALQAYLDRSPQDLHRIREGGIIPRLVKGAYTGDVSGFEHIQERFRTLVTSMREVPHPFHVGTHDPDLLSWLRTLNDPPGEVTFGFLMGLSDITKRSIAREGWRVSEYLPIGREGGAYISRRERYLAELRRLGRDPAP